MASTRARGAIFGSSEEDILGAFFLIGDALGVRDDVAKC